jgi:hypothetical protein
VFRSATNVDHVPQRSPVIGRDDGWRPLRDIGAHLRGVGRRTSGVGRESGPDCFASDLPPTTILMACRKKADPRDQT